MEENVIEELDTLKGMLNNWKRGFPAWASPGGDNEHVLLEFREEIEEQLYSYVTRLLSYIPEPELNFKEFCKNWARLILKIYEVDPLTCPKCWGSMRIIHFWDGNKVGPFRPEFFAKAAGSVCHLSLSV